MFSATPYQEIDVTKAVVQPLYNSAWQQKNISVSVLRLDLIHPVISGNKWFKLKYYLQHAKQTGKKGIVTFGGAWSNHLVAAAYAAKLQGLEAIGIVRGEEPAIWSQTLIDARLLDMDLKFIPRDQFTADEEDLAIWENNYPGYLVVPQGGQGSLGVRGAVDILNLVPSVHQYTHIACAIGTGTMITGIIEASAPHQQVIGISSLKLENTHDNSIITFICEHTHKTNFYIQFGYHFGGYARKKQSLIDFMNEIYRQHQLPTDFVYTGKLLYGISDMIANGALPDKTNLLLIHSGGLQGNRSLPAGSLIF